jgi:3-hydroxyisobutyrate dehydrogenase
MSRCPTEPAGAADDPAVTVLGMGAMGAPIAANLARSGLPVTGWSRDPARVTAAAASGVRAADSLDAALGGADVLITLLPDADSIEAVLASIVALPSHLLWLQMSTVGLYGAGRLHEIAEAAGWDYVDCPVVGSVGPARDATLTVLASGRPEHRERAQAIFDRIGRRTVWVGATHEASTLKLIVNSWVLSLTAAVGECLALADGLGVPPAAFLDVLRGSLMDSGYAHLKAAQMLDPTAPVSFSVDLALKDAALIEAAAQAGGVNSRLNRAVADTLRASVAQGLGARDFAAMYDAARPTSAPDQ